MLREGQGGGPHVQLVKNRPLVSGQEVVQAKGLPAVLPSSFTWLFIFSYDERCFGNLNPLGHNSQGRRCLLLLLIRGDVMSISLMAVGGVIVWAEIH